MEYFWAFLHMNFKSYTCKIHPVYHNVQIYGVIVTVRSVQTEYDFVSRYFAPWNGIPEDPVTGAIPCMHACAR